nr:PREDICTED: interferon gamma receptor 2-like isoform X1 [Lepisosteus oculatus]
MDLKHVLTLMFVCQVIHRGLSVLVAPDNVTIISKNLLSILYWSPVTAENWTVHYRVQYKLSSHDNKWSWTDIETCNPTNKTECNFTSAIRASFTVNLRVRAESGTDFSSWSETESFCALNETVIGPPNVNLIPGKRAMTVVASVPPSLKNEYKDHLKYSVVSFKKDDPMKKVGFRLQKSPILFEDLVPWTRYCVNVSIVISKFTELKTVPKKECTDILEDEETKSIKLLVISVLIPIGVIAMVIGCLFLVKKNYGHIKHLLLPVWEVPNHIQQFLAEPSYEFCEMPLSSYSREEPCDTITVLLEID